MSDVITVDTRGLRVELWLHQGASMVLRHQLTNEDATPADLTGFVVRGQARRTALNSTVLFSFRTRVAPVPTEGWYEVWLTDEDTAGLSCGPNPLHPDSTFEFDVELEDPSGDVRCTLYGPGYIQAGSTR